MFWFNRLIFIYIYRYQRVFMAKRVPMFKPYFQDQIMAIPPSLDELVSKSHPVRIVNDVINRINIQGLLDVYKIKDSSSYHPQMLLKVLVFGYVSNIYSSRKLEMALPRKC